MQSYKYEFIQFAHQQHILRFGDFTLKSGRKSPYFFNTGLFNTGATLQQLGYYYATVIQQAKLEFDMLFGPAYKGIPLVCATVTALAQHYQRDIPYCFNRKEVKSHGEGGDLIGAPLHNRVLIIDDVISAGTAKQEAKQLIESHGATVAGIVVALDRQERDGGKLSASQQVEQDWQVPVCSIIQLDDLLNYLQPQDNMHDIIEQIKQYRLTYCTIE